MATNKRTFPNDYFAWYNDDNRLAVVNKVLTSDVSDSTETTTDTFDTYTGSDVTEGLRIHYHAKYGEATSPEQELSSELGVDTGLNAAIVDYVRSRILEDARDMQNAVYFRARYEKTIKQYPHRKTGVRFLAVPRI